MYWAGAGESKIDKLHSSFEDFLNTFKDTAQKFVDSKDISEDSFKEESSNLEDTLAAVKRDISELTNSVRKFSYLRTFYVYVWYLAAPVAFSIISLYYGWHA
jgi:hypothetical protein